MTFYRRRNEADARQSFSFSSLRVFAAQTARAFPEAVAACCASALIVAWGWLA